MTAFLRTTHNPHHGATTFKHSPYILFSTCILNQMTSKDSKLWYKFEKNVAQKFANRRNILTILLSNSDPKFYNVLSKTC